MTVQRAVRLFAGTMVFASVALDYFVSPYWYLLTAFIGINLFQSAFTNWCPAISIFRALGLKDAPTVCAV